MQSSAADILKALIVGGVTGAVFAIAKLPIPAPNVVAGVVGIIGIFLGYWLVTVVR